jgi:hypothetical protein
MKNLFKKNPSLFIGLALPLLMMLSFAGVPFISSYLVPPPKYNFIYSLYDNGLKETLRVVDGKLILNVYNPRNEPVETDPQFYLVDVASKNSTKLNLARSGLNDFVIPPLKSREFILKGIPLKSLDTSLQSPDGYQMRATKNDNFLSFGFFFGGNRINYLSLSKSSRIYKILPVDSWSVKFEGWVIP